MTPADTMPRLPWRSPQPDAPAARKRVRALRAACYVILAVALIVPVIQFEAGLAEQLGEARAFDAHKAAGKVPPGAERPPAHNGAIERWRSAFENYWAGDNIYTTPPPDGRAAARERGYTGTDLHPNMPFIVILLSAFTALPPMAGTIVFNVLKIVVILASIWMAVEVANHNGRRMGDWVAALGVAWALRFIIGDVQHANTNVLVMGAVVWHLWLYRRGHDLLAGLPLAAGICLKLTPALFVPYWLYQRNWKLAGATAVGLVLLMVVVPTVATGPSRFVRDTGTWVNNLIIPGLVRNSWFPTHVNQSVPGVAARYFLEGRDGNMNWDPDVDPNYIKTDHEWITVVALPEQTVQLIVRAVQVAIVALMAWSIGLPRRDRLLPRDDGRRALHYGLIVLAMMLLNQRTWDHHATVLLIAGVALWHAIAYGRMGRAARATALTLTLLAGIALWTTGNDLFVTLAEWTGHGEDAGEHWADVYTAYGNTFYVFVLLFAATVICAVAIRRRDDPFAATRQPLTAQR
ncbi:MAG: DUF2029 domain-containing protein [Phycisphaerae bacterium]|nr:DUF2029 domain-containing protein [Phycisphaerae bacterium]